MTFYASRRYVASLFLRVSLLAIPAGFGFIAAGRAWAVALGAAILIVAGIPVYVRAMRPVLQVDDAGTRVTATSPFGGARSAGPISELGLVVSRDFLAFRQGGVDQMIIDRQVFSGRWKEVTDALKQFPFGEVIEPSAEH